MVHAVRVEAIRIAVGREGQILFALENLQDRLLNTAIQHRRNPRKRDLPSRLGILTRFIG
jgi:hypothetical protein